MNRQELRIAVVILSLIAIGGVAIKFGKLKMGNPGLIVESGTLTNELGEVVRHERIKLPIEPPGFISRDAPISNWELSTLPKDTTYGRKLYRAEDGFRAQLSGVLMKSDRTSIHRPQVCVTGQGWRIEKTDVIKIPIASPRPYELSATCLTLGKEVANENEKTKRIYKGVYIYWFVSENRLASTHPEAIWNITKDLLTEGTLHPWGYISCFSTCPPGAEEVLTARMKRLIAATVPDFQKTTAIGKESASLGDPISVEGVTKTASLAVKNDRE